MNFINLFSSDFCSYFKLLYYSINILIFSLKYFDYLEESNINHNPYLDDKATTIFIKLSFVLNIF